MLKSLVILSQLALVNALSPGDCAFVGIYGDQDDFALVMMEDVDGEDLSLTEEYPSSSHFEVSNFVVAKKHVGDAKRGTVLKKEDFETDASTFVAPTALTVFTGSAKFPTALCSINLEDTRAGTVARKLNEEVSVVMLGLTETAQYGGSFSGSKAELLEDISNPENWQRTAPRKLAHFSIAKVNDTTSTTTSGGGPPQRTVVSACTELGGDLQGLADNQEEAAAAIADAVSGLLELPKDYVQNVVFTPGASCGGGKRRLNDRRLQTSGTVTYDLVFPASLGTALAQEKAQAALTTLSSATIDEVQALVTEAIKSYPTIKDLTVTVTSVTVATETESGGSTETTSTGTVSTSGTTSTTTTTDPHEPPDEGSYACQGSLALGLLTILGSLM